MAPRQAGPSPYVVRVGEMRRHDRADEVTQAAVENYERHYGSEVICALSPRWSRCLARK